MRDTGGHLEDEGVVKNDAGDAGGDDVNQRQNQSPQRDYAVRLRQLYQLSHLEARQVVHDVQYQQRLRPRTETLSACFWMYSTGSTCSNPSVLLSGKSWRDSLVSQVLV